ncbi:MAG: hypothetical protein ACT4QB_12085 [Gammaproteobacteria bacterium]
MTTAATRGAFAEQLRALAASESPAHAYLDTESNNAGVEIVVSKGEYDDNLKPA